MDLFTGSDVLFVTHFRRMMETKKKNCYEIRYVANEEGLVVEDNTRTIIALTALVDYAMGVNGLIFSVSFKSVSIDHVSVTVT